MLRSIALLLAFFATGLSMVPGQRVYDFAGIIPDAMEAELELELDTLERTTTAEVDVVTVQTLSGQTVDEYGFELFNEWKIGKADVNNGVLFLIAPQERRARIEVGYGLEGLITDEIAKEILDNEAVPYFKQGDFPAGIKAGTRAIIDTLTRYPEAARGVPGSLPSYVKTPRRAFNHTAYWMMGLFAVLLGVGWWKKKARRYSFVSFLVVIGLIAIGSLYVLHASRSLSGETPFAQVGGTVAAAFAALAYNVRRYFRYRPHYCEHCSTELKLLGEVEDDAKLTKEEQLEEKLGAVDYDVWVCPACLKERKKEYTTWMSGFAGCPQCKRRTFFERATVVTAATTYSTGKRRIDGECRNCFKTTKRFEIIPRVSKSSGSSGGFSGGGGGGGGGGGSSGGGGASSGW